MLRVQSPPRKINRFRIRLHLRQLVHFRANHDIKSISGRKLRAFTSHRFLSHPFPFHLLLPFLPLRLGIVKVFQVFFFQLVLARGDGIDDIVVQSERVRIFFRSFLLLLLLLLSFVLFSFLFLLCFPLLFLLSFPLRRRLRSRFRFFHSLLFFSLLRELLRLPRSFLQELLLSRFFLRDGASDFFRWRVVRVRVFR